MGSQFIVSSLLAFFMSYGGYAKKSLSFSGAVAAFLVGTITFWSSVRCGVLLITFFITSSLATRVGKKTKLKIEGENFTLGGGRTWVQVISNAPATILCGLMLLRGHEDEAFVLAYFFQLSAMQGDTWSSELGVLSSGRPFSIATFDRVPAGTNGAISFLGMIGCVTGGVVISLSFWCASVSGTSIWKTLAMGVSAALVGSLLDSLLGGYVQYSGWHKKKKIVVEIPGPDVEYISGRAWLDNHQVNLVTSIIMMVTSV